MRLKAFVAPGQPRLAGGVAPPLAAQVPQGRAVTVLGPGLGPQVEPPSGLLQPPGEVGVLGGADALEEAARLLEGRPAHQQVGRRRPGPERMLEVSLLAQKAASGAVAGHQRLLAGRRSHPPRHRSHVLGDVRREVGVEQRFRGAAVGVQEQDPAIAGPGRTLVAGMGRGALCLGLHHRHAVGAGDRTLVVDQDQLVAGRGAQRAQRRHRGVGLGPAAGEWHHHADLRPVHSRLLCARPGPSAA